MTNKIQIKRGTTDPPKGTLDIGELGYNQSKRTLFVGNGVNNSSTQINGFEYYEKTTDAQIDELLYTFINSSDLPNNDSKHMVLYVSKNGCKIPTNKYFIEICKSSSNYGIINAIGYGTSTGPRHYMRIWAENVLQDWINMRDLQSFGITATTTEINVLDGVTASTAEINRLDGLTPTTTELNYVDGVTSNIQTQLNNKVPTSRTINGKSLTNNINLSADDVGARSSTWIPTKEDLLNTIWPVGSIYIAYHHTSPAGLFGGTWTRITNKFLWGIDSSSTIGSGSGEQTVALTVDQMPSHNHALIRPQWFAADGDGNISVVHQTGTMFGYTGTLTSIYRTNQEDYGVYPAQIVKTGGGAAHNNMPPYINVSIWRRTA